MKKILALLMVVVLCISLCACGGNKNSTATVITNGGDTVEVSAQDLFDEYDFNEVRFAKKYSGATIEFIGTVDYIKTDTDVYTGESVNTEQNKIVFKEGWCLILGAENTSYDLADYYPGQKLKVSTGIVSAAFDTEFLQSTADNNRVVWLVGNDKLLYNEVINSQTTTILIEE